MLLFFPSTEYDVESVMQVFFSVLCTALVLLGAFMACSPGGKAEQALLATSKAYPHKPNSNDSWVCSF